MKQLLLALILFLSPLFAFCEDLTVLGIPLNGTIESFTTKLKSQGHKVSVESAKLPLGQRMFEVIFGGDDALLLVTYDTVTKKVYDAVLTFSSFKKSDLTKYYEQFKKNLPQKIQGPGSSVTAETDIFHHNTLWRYKYSRNNSPIGRAYIYWWEIPADDEYDTIYQLNIRYRRADAPSFEEETQYLY